MKKIIFVIVAIIAVTTAYISCDSRKILGHDPAPSVPVIDSIAFDVTQEEDTINLKSIPSGGYTWRYRCFSKRVANFV